MQRHLISLILLLCIAGGTYTAYHYCSQPLEGHWHVHPLRNSRIDTSTFLTLDVDNQRSATLDGWRTVKLPLMQQILPFTGECLSLNWMYTWNGADLLLHSIQYDTEGDASWMAVRQPLACKHSQLDFFRAVPLAIELPVYRPHQTHSSTYLSEISLSIYLPIYISQSLGGSHIAVEGVSHVLSRELLPKFINQHKIKLPEAKREFARPIIYADRLTPSAVLENLIRDICELEGQYPLIGFDTPFGNTFAERVTLLEPDAPGFAFNQYWGAPSN